VTLRAVNECPARPKAGYRSTQRLWRECSTVENRKATVGWRTADGRRLGKLGGEVDEIVELALKLERQYQAVAAPPSHSPERKMRLQLGQIIPNANPSLRSKKTFDTATILGMFFVDDFTIIRAAAQPVAH